MLQQVGLLAGLTRRHRGRQVNEPLRVHGEAAHHFERGDGVFFANGQVAVQLGFNNALADDIINVENIILRLLL